jgi:hypothetical protein
MTMPHDFVPAGPVETAPLVGYCRPEIRREAFAAVLGERPHGRLRRAHGRVAGRLG